MFRGAMETARAHETDAGGTKPQILRALDNKKLGAIGDYPMVRPTIAK